MGPNMTLGKVFEFCNSTKLFVNVVLKMLTDRVEIKPRKPSYSKIPGIMKFVYVEKGRIHLCFSEKLGFSKIQHFWIKETVSEKDYYNL